MIEALLSRLERALMAVAGLCVILLMLVVSCDAVSRYLFRAPLPWAFEFVVNYLLVAALYLPVSATFQSSDHVSIETFSAKLPPKVRVWTGSICGLLAAILFAAVTYGAVTTMVDAYGQDEFIPGYVRWPMWLSILPIMLGTGLLVLRLIHHSVTQLRRGEDPNVEPVHEGLE